MAYERVCLVLRIRLAMLIHTLDDNNDNKYHNDNMCDNNEGVLRFYCDNNDDDWDKDNWYVFFLTF